MTNLITKIKKCGLLAKIVTTLIVLMIIATVWNFAFNAYADSNIKTLEANIETNNSKISDIQNAKAQLHNTAELFRTSSLADETFINVLSDKWNELNSEEKMLNDSNIEFQAEIEKIRAKRVYLGVFEATAYCYGSRTATGTTPTANRTIAVDPRVIPYGTKVEIEGYGTYIAEDCGGAVKGNIIDIYIPGYNNCIQFGRRKVKVYILNE